MLNSSIFKRIFAGFLVLSLSTGIILSQTLLIKPANAADSDLTIEMTARNLSSNYYYSSYSDSVSATGRDRMQFRINIRNNGNYIIYNARVSANLPSDLGFVSGTTRVEGSYVADGLTGNGIYIGTIYPGYNREVLFEATVADRGSGYSNQTLTAYAYVRADQFNEKNDSTTVYASSPNSPYYPYYPSLYLNIYNYVRNMTTGEGSLSSSVNAKAGDKLMFTIQLTSTGSSQINNIRVWDNLPSGLIYVADSARLDSASLSDSLITGGGVYIGSIFGSQTKTITYEATVNSNLANQTITNYAYVSGDGISQQSAFSQIIIGGYYYSPSPTPTYSPYPSYSPSHSPLPWPNYTQTSPSPSPMVKGVAVRAVTGGNSLAQTAGIALITTLLAIMAVYAALEYPESWRKLDLKIKVLKIKLKENS